MNAILLQKQNAKFLDIQNAKKGKKEMMEAFRKEVISALFS